MSYSHCILDRQQKFYNQRGLSGSRRWDCFGGKSPTRSGPGRSPKQSSGFGEYTNTSYNRMNDGFKETEKRNVPRNNYKQNSVACFYSVLQVCRTANQQEIKKSYYNLARKYHPDKNNGVDASETFRQIQLAYETLKEPLKRKEYDIVRFCK